MRGAGTQKVVGEDATEVDINWIKSLSLLRNIAYLLRFLISLSTCRRR